MRTSTVRAIMLALLVAAPSLAAADHSGDDDCGTTGDAGDASGTATRLTPAVFECLGWTNTSDDDWFVFALDAGTSLVVSFNGGATISLYDPTLSSVAFKLDQPVDVTTSGDWRIRLVHDAITGVPSSYSLTFWSREAGGQGANMVRQALPSFTPAHGVNGYLGPSEHDGVDGTWFDLPRTSMGGEHLVVESASGVSVFFYAANGEERGEAHTCHRACGVPADADRMLIASAMPLALIQPVEPAEFTYVYRY